jgi:hypothetical protein
VTASVKWRLEDRTSPRLLAIVAVEVVEGMVVYDVSEVDGRE